MGKKLDLKNQRFGRLQVFSESTKRNCGNVVWLCLCGCGALTEVTTDGLRSGGTKSCGCMRRGKTKIRDYNQTGDARSSSSPIYAVWSGMKTRCYNKNNKRYCDYGKRGISVCDAWLGNFELFHSWCISNGYKVGLQIDREDNDKDYEPDNCRFVTSAVNSFNRRTVIKSNKSSYCGVFLRRNGKYRAFVRYRSKLYHIGTFNDPLDAAIARDRYVITNAWPHKLNFPGLRE